MAIYLVLVKICFFHCCRLLSKFTSICANKECYYYSSDIYFKSDQKYTVYNMRMATFNNYEAY